MSFESPTAARAASHRSWANTVNRTQRTRAAVSKSPGSIEYHLARLGDRFANATDDERYAAAESARKAHMAQMSARAAEARRRKRVAT
jgi:hypothetical protein